VANSGGRDRGRRVVAVRIELDNLERPTESFQHVYESSELDFTDERVRLIGVPEISARVIRTGSQVFLNGRLTVLAQVDCDRCLKSIDVPVDTEFNLQYVTAADYAAMHAAALEESDLALSVFDGEAIDVDEIVREQVLLAVPTRSLCREGCKGFCPACGTDRNLKECGCQTGDSDPRWAGLKDLANRK
jgi:uncharacterized protein